jgi:hypothetical protein
MGVGGGVGRQGRGGGGAVKGGGDEGGHAMQEHIEATQYFQAVRVGSSLSS